MVTTTWRKDVTEHLSGHGEVFADVERCSISDEDMDREFEDDYGWTRGIPFILWTKTRVVFPVCYCGTEWVESVPRNPCEESLEHHFGG